jgi:hypothetical protein
MGAYREHSEHPVDASLHANSREKANHKGQMPTTNEMAPRAIDNTKIDAPMRCRGSEWEKGSLA